MQAQPTISAATDGMAPVPPASAPHPLLSAPVVPALLRFALPNMAAMGATALAAVAETAYVGHLGVSALAGMALVFPAVMLQQMLSGGAMGGGISSAISRALGAGDRTRADALAVHALWIGLAAGLATTVLMLGWGPALFAAVGGRGDSWAQAVAYSQVAFTGSAAVWLMNTLASVVRGGGDMKVPSATYLAVSVAQVAIGGGLGLGWGPLPRLGMPGVAAGQVIAYAAGAAWLAWHLRSGRAAVRLAVRSTPVRAALFRAILKVGGVACIAPLQTVASVLILTTLVARFGAPALAGYGIGTRLEFLLVPIAFAIGVASVPLVGMAIGAGRIARARRVAWAAAGLATGLLAALGAVLAIAPDLWSGLYTADPDVRAAAATYFHWAGPAYGLFGLGLSLYFSSLGAGKVGGPVLAGTLRLVVVALGGWAVASVQAPAWAIYALVAAAMAAYGLASVAAVKAVSWGVERS